MCSRATWQDNKGFTLIEIALVLVIIGILVGLGADLFPVLVRQNKLKENRAIVEETRVAILGYALAKGRLPYASSTADGTEDTGVTSGYLPYITVGGREKDIYLKTLYYAVDPYLCNTTGPSDLKSHLQDLITGAHTPDLFYSTSIAAAFIVLSSGENLVVDSPNDDNGNGRVDMGDNNQFADPDAPVTSTYDDIIGSASDTYLYGRMP